MNFNVVNFIKNEKIKKEYICKDEEHGGLSITPTIKWKPVNNAQSYAIILQDPDVPGGLTYIHMYVPYISKDINEISSIDTKNMPKNINKRVLSNIDISNPGLKLFFGKNSHGYNQYYGPCNPETNKDHRYTFKIYALNGVVPPSLWNNPISKFSDFEKMLSDNRIKILDSAQKIYNYRLGD
jgi:Raf kinase inhibitor-like YbhB/YbcL family protein